MIKSLVRAVKGLHKNFRFERARGEAARLNAYQPADLRPLLDEAIAILAGESSSIAGAAAIGLKGQVSQRPAIFDSGMPLLWIKTRKAQDRVAELALDHIAGKVPAIAQADKDFFESFAGDVPDDLPRFDIEDVVDEALRFLLASLDRNLSAGEKLQLGHLLPRIDNLAEKMQEFGAAPSPVALEAFDRAIESQLYDILTALDLDERGKMEAALLLASGVMTGDLKTATPELRAKAIAWAARLAVRKTEQAKLDELVSAAAAIALTDHVRVAAAMCAPLSWTDALDRLQPLGSPVLRGGAVRLRARGADARDALLWFEQTGWDDVDLDADGRLMLMNIRARARAWDGLSSAVGKLTEEDFATQPDLLHMAAVALTAPSLSEDIRHLLFEGVPFGAASIPLAGDGAALAEREAAAKFFRRASEAALARRGPEAARQWKEMELWLKLHDPRYAAAARADIVRGLGSPDEALSLLPLAFDFGILVDLAAADTAIAQAMARKPKGSLEIARARLARILAETDGRARASKLAESEDELSAYLNRGALTFMRAAAIAEADKQAALALVADARTAGLGSPQLDRLAADLHLALGSADTEYSLDLATASTADLSAEFARVARDGPAERFLEVGELLLSRTRATRVAEEQVGRLEAFGRIADAERILDNDAADLVEASPMLRTSRAWAAFRRGDIDAADTDLRLLEASRDDSDDRALRFNLCLISGRWDEINSLVESYWAASAERSAEELLEAAKLAAALGHPRRDSLTDIAAGKGAADPEILAGSYFLAVGAGRENEPGVAGWLKHAAELSGPDGPIQEASLADLVHEIPDRRRRQEDMLILYRRGELSLFQLSELQRRTLLDVQLLTMFRNREALDPRRRTLVNLYSGSRSPPGSCPTPPAAIAFDAASLLTLAFLGRLEEAFAAFDRVILPHGVLSWLFNEMLRLSHRQPSQIAHAKEIRRWLGLGRLGIASDEAASPGRIDKVGVLLAGLTELAERERLEGRDAFVVHPYPATAPGSLGGEPIEGEGVDGLFISCHALIRGAARELDEPGRERAEAFLKLKEKPWPGEAVPAADTIILLDELSLAHLRAAGALESVMRAYRDIRVSKTVADEADALIEREILAQEVRRIVETIRSTAATAIASGKARLAPAILEEGVGQHPSVASLLAPGVDAIVSDERSSNRYSRMDRDSDSVPIWTTLDILSCMGLAEEEIRRSHVQLRRAGVAFVPLRQSDVEAMMAKASIDAGGRLIETAELKALRENLRLCQAEALLRLPAEALWATALDQALIPAIRAQWDGEIDAEVASARSDWLLRLADLRGWAGAIEGPTVATIARDGLGGLLSRLLTSYSDGESPEFAKWLKKQTDHLAVEVPAEYRALIADLRTSTREAASDRLGSQLDPSLNQSEIAQIFLHLLPPYMRVKVAADLSLQDEFSLAISGKVRIGGSLGIFDRSAFHAEVAAFLAGEKREPLLDEQGNRWTLTRLAPDRSVVRAAREDGEGRAWDFFAIDPDAERRLSGFEVAAAGAGMDPDSRAYWRKRLHEGPLPSDRTVYLDRDLAATPGRAAARLLALSEEDGIGLQDFVPHDRRHYERLVGVGTRNNLADYTEQVVRPFQRLRLAEGEQGIREATLAGGHASFAAELAEGLDQEECVALVHWATDHADPMAMVLVIEAVLARSDRGSVLEDAIILLADRLKAMLKEERVADTFSALFVLSDGELASAAVFDDVPPFVRRAMALANAALIFRTVGESLELAEFHEWVMENRGYQFMLRSLLDMRIEPRWEPGFAEPHQLRQELIGRLVHVAAAAAEASRLDGPLRELMLGSEESILALAELGYAFPGPLEGESTTPPFGNPAVLEQVDASLAQPKTSLAGLSLLINVRRAGDIGPHRVEALTDQLRRSQYLVEGLDDEHRRSSLLQGIAAIAAAARSEALADAVGIAVRRIRRVEPTGQDLVREFRVALIAAAAHADEAPWAGFIGDRALELAIIAPVGEPSQLLLLELLSLCGLEPSLRIALGRAIAMLRLAEGK